MATATIQKRLGSFYTPPSVARTLVRWVVRQPSDKLLDPSCGDGRFLEAHRNSVGVDCDIDSVVAATKRSGHATVHAAGFFDWASASRERFDCVAGNPPFIRYQHFAGAERDNAFRLCSRLGVRFTALASSWAPFLVVAATMLKPGGRMAFVVPAEIGHAPYAAPLLTFLMRHFSRVQLVAIKEKLFPGLSEDVWILYADGFQNTTDHILLSRQERFADGQASPPKDARQISLKDLDDWQGRIRPFLMPDGVRNLYAEFRNSDYALRLGSVAKVGIGYVSGANDFFHFRPSEAKRLGVPNRYLIPTVRNGRCLPSERLTQKIVDGWLHRDEPVLLLRLPKHGPLPKAIYDYLDSPEGHLARAGYKCRNRSPWYAVPDVRVPDAFLSYMIGENSQLVANDAKCSCTNSVHGVSMAEGFSVDDLLKMWRHPVVALSCEVEGHPLGGGMLKIEPGEAARIAIPREGTHWRRGDLDMIREGIAAMRTWRHYA